MKRLGLTFVESFILVFISAGMGAVLALILHPWFGTITFFVYMILTALCYVIFVLGSASVEWAMKFFGRGK